MGRSVLMVVGEAPTKEDTELGEIHLGEVMKGSAWNMVRDILFDNIGAKPEEVYLTYLVKDYGIGAPDKKQLSEYWEKLEAEIKEVQPVAILTLGELVFTTLTGAKKISKQRGQEVPIAIEGYGTVTVVPTYSPNYINYAPNQLQQWALDILKSYKVAIGESTTNTKTKVVYCDTMEKVKTAIKYCKEAKMCSFDLESVEIPDKGKGTFDRNFFATCIGLSFQIGSAYVIPLEHEESPFSKKEVVQIMHAIGKHLLADPEVRKVAHNADFDMHVFRHYGWTLLRGRIDDTMLMHHLWDETRYHGLDTLVNDFMPSYSGYWDNMMQYPYSKWHTVPMKILVPYNGTDAAVSLEICLHLENLLLEDTQVYLIYRNLTMACFKPLWEGECNGVRIDRPYLLSAIEKVGGVIDSKIATLRDHKVVKRYELKKAEAANNAAIREVTERLEKWRSEHKAGLATEIKLENKLKDLKAGSISVYEPLNFGSWQQLEDLFYDSPYGFQFKNLTRGTAKEVIEEFDDDTGFVDGLLVLRTLEKIYGTYLVGMLERLDDNDRLHTTYKLAGTVSGRLSSANPNLQNIPNIAKLTDPDAIEAVGMVKKCFIPDEDHDFLQGDFSQGELRIIAAFAGEKTMLEIYKRDGDIHTTTAAKIVGMSEEEFANLEGPEKKKYRTRAKPVNFGFIYGMSADTFVVTAKKDYRLIIPKEEAEEYRTGFFELYSGLPPYYEKQKQRARQYGWVRTLLGRKRRTPDIDHPDGAKRSFEERVAVNSPVQGTLGEFMNFGIALLYHRLDSAVQRFANTVHDSVQYYSRKDKTAATGRMMKLTCENLPTEKYFGVKLPHIGMKMDLEKSDVSWKDLKEYDLEGAE